MTRPMHEPPECECREVPAHLWTTYAGAVDPNTLFEYTPECPLHGEVSSPKRLTDAECWAEYHHADAAWAKATVQVLMGDRPMTDELNEGLHCQLEETGVWHRFATHPHALEEA